MLSETLTLREVHAESPGGAELMRLFERSREHVLRVAASAALPHVLAVATRNGFLEIIDGRSGAVRLFCTHLQAIPLDAPLRCLSLAPALHAAADAAPGVTPVLYSLSFSNELLLAGAGVAGGAVTVLQQCGSRPSCVAADASYLCCGEGSGAVTVWRCLSAREAPRRVWGPAELFGGTAAVTALQTAEAALVVCSADCRTVVVDLPTGAVVARLLQDREPAVCCLPLLRPRLPHAVVALCTPTSLGVFAVPATLPVAGGGPQDGASQPMALPAATVRLDLPVQCASALGGYAAAGTESGAVLLFSTDAAAAAVRELARFDVGYAVVGLQLTPDDALTVVTSTGDVWRWPLSELLEPEPPNAPGTDTGAATAAAAAVAATAETPVSVGGTPPPEQNATQIGGGSGSDSEEEEKEEEEEVLSARAGVGAVNTSDHADADSDATAARDAPRETPVEPPAPQATSPTSSGRGSADASARESTKAAGGGEIGGASPGQPPSAPAIERGDGADSSGGSSSGHYTPIADEETEEEDGNGDAVTVNSGGGGTAHTAQSTSATSTGASSRQEPSAARSASGQLVLDDGGSSGPESGASPEAPQPSRPSAAAAAAAVVAAVQERLQVPAEIKGLRAGRRMDPRRVAAALQQQHGREPAGGDAPDGSGGVDLDAELFAADAAPSSAELLRAQLAALDTRDFDYEAYCRQHPLQAAALRHRFPVVAPRYAPEDRLFSALEGAAKSPAGRITGGAEGGVGGGEEGALEDDLQDVMHGRVARYMDPAIEEERRRGGPDIAAHGCDELLFGPTARLTTPILFAAPRVRQPPAEPLMPPLPVPQTPPVF